MPPENFCWTCDSGITPHFFEFFENYDFCVLVQLVPLVAVFSGQAFLDTHDTLVLS